MQLSLSPSSLLLWGLLASLGSAAPAPQGEILTLPGGIPPTCIKFEDGVIKTPSCYTRTTTTKPTNCPLIKCAAPTIMCPAYIKITTTSVPCSTDCCPTTPTKAVTTRCPTCTTGCVIPTETVTVTTGCKTETKPGGSLITATATFIVG